MDLVEKGPRDRVSIIIANEKGRLSRVEIDRMAQRASSYALRRVQQSATINEP